MLNFCDYFLNKYEGYKENLNFHKEKEILNKIFEKKLCLFVTRVTSKKGLHCLQHIAKTAIIGNSFHVVLKVVITTAKMYLPY